MKEKNHQKKRTLKTWRMLLCCLIVVTMLFTAAECATLGSGEGMTLKITFDAEGGDPEVAEILQDFCGWVRVSMEEDAELINYSLDYQNDTAISVLARIGTDKISFQIPVIDDTVYEINASTASETLGTLFAYAQAALKDPEHMGDSAKQIENVSAAFLPIIETIRTKIMEDATVMDGATIQLDGSQKTVDNCHVFVYQPDAQQLQSLLSALADTVEADEALDAFTSYIAAQIRSGVLTVEASGGDDAQQIQQVLAMVENARVFLPMYLRQNGAALGQQLAQLGLEISVAVSEDGTVRCSEIAAGPEGQRMSVSTEMIKDESDVEFYCAVQQGGYAVLKATVDATEQDGIVTGRADLTSAQIGSSLQLTYSFDKNEKTALGAACGVVELNFSGITATVTIGQDTEDKDLYTVELNNLNMLEESMPSRMTIFVEATKDNTAVSPEGPVTDISGMSDEELGALFEQIGDAVEAHLGQMEPGEPAPSSFAGAFSNNF